MSRVSYAAVLPSVLTEASGAIAVKSSLTRAVGLRGTLLMLGFCAWPCWRKWLMTLLVPAPKQYNDWIIQKKKKEEEVSYGANGKIIHKTGKSSPFSVSAEFV